MKILAIKRVNVKTKSGDIKPSILVTTASGDVWVTEGQFKAAGGSNSLDSYTGGNIEAEYFSKGDILFDGVTPCTDDNKILKSVLLSANPRVLAYAVAAEAEMKAEQASDLALLYSRKRAEAKAKEDSETINLVEKTNGEVVVETKEKAIA